MHHTQHLSARRLTTYEILLLTSPHMTLIHYNSLNPAIPLPSCTDEIPHVCLTLMDHLLTPHDDLQETPLVNADLVN